VICAFFAACLTELKRYDEAERILRAADERYPNSVMWYRWCQETGKGDLAAARAAAVAVAAEVEKSKEVDLYPEVAVVHELEGQADRARECWTRALEKTKGPFEAMQLALNEIQRGNIAEAAAALEKADVQGVQLPERFTKLLGNAPPSPDERRRAAYGAAIEEVQRCLADPNAVPKRDGEMKQVLNATGNPYRGTITYSMGRLCEIRGKKEDAAWWYRQSLDGGEWTHTSRPQAAAGLRRLGREYYK
jgi:tetratricopeptide (TPR) repeat protein